MALPQFIFGGSTGVSSPKELARKRAIAEALLMQNSQADNVGEGIAALVNGIAIGQMHRNWNAAEGRGQAGAAQMFRNLLAGGGSANPATSPAPKQDYASNRVAQAHETAGGSGAQIREGLITRGLPPHVADAFVMNMKDESNLNPGINEANPIVPGSRGGFGLSQWTGPRRRALEAFAAEKGVPVSDMNMQLDFLMSELQGPERAAAEKILASKDTGSAAAAIVNSFLRPAEQHRAAREARYLRSGGPQVASLDPSAGMPTGLAAAEPQAFTGPVSRENIPVPASGFGQLFGNMPMSPDVPQQAQMMPQQTQTQQAPQAMPQQQMAQASGPSIEQLYEAISNPWLSDEQRAVVGSMLEQKMQQSDPMRQLQIRKLQRELTAQPERKTTTINGRLVDAQTGEEIAKYDDPVKPTSDMQEYEFAKQQGFPGSFVDFQIAQKKAGATNVTTNVGEGDKFYENLDKKNAETFAALSETGTMARAKAGQIDRLDELLTRSPQGASAMLKQAAGEYGINTEGLSDIQAAQALINELVPQQRQPGSGPMSDADLALFKQSLPRLINQPEGNQLILDTMRGITRYQIQMGDIADLVADREISPAEGRKMIRELANPLAGFGQKIGQSQSAPRKPAVIDGYTIEEVD